MESTTEESRNLHALLETFLIDNTELEELERQFERFNLFEAIGMVQQEIRHSQFLAYLLDPQQSHGIADTFATRLIHKALDKARYEDSSFKLPITPVELALWTLDGLTVLREWNNIDILLLDHANQLAVIIENKIFTGEHDNQLNRYYNITQDNHPGWRIIGILLSPTGVAPVDDEGQHYIPIDYRLISEILSEILERRRDTIGEDVALVIRHYIEMLRRHIVSDDIPKLCQAIYRKHKQAIDLIIQYIPDQQAELLKKLELLIQQTGGLALSPSYGRTVLYFTIQKWNVPGLRINNEQTLYFQIDNEARRIRVRFMLGLGNEEIRHELFNMAWNNRGIFQPQSKTLGKYNTIAIHELLGSRDFEEIYETEALAMQLEKR